MRPLEPPLQAAQALTKSLADRSEWVISELPEIPLPSFDIARLCGLTVTEDQVCSVDMPPQLERLQELAQAITAICEPDAKFRSQLSRCSCASLCVCCVLVYAGVCASSVCEHLCVGAHVYVSV